MKKIDELAIGTLRETHQSQSSKPNAVVDPGGTTSARLSMGSNSLVFACFCCKVPDLEVGTPHGSVPPMGWHPPCSYHLKVMAHTKVG